METFFVPCLSLIQAVAKLVMPDKGWAYYSSAADDEITLRENHAAYHRYVRPYNSPFRISVKKYYLEYGSDQGYCVMLQKSTIQQQYLGKNLPCLFISYALLSEYDLSSNTYCRLQRLSEN